MQSSLNICLVGATGKMGQAIITESRSFQEKGISKVRILSGIVDEGNPCLGTLIPGVERPITTAWEAQCSEADLMIDFSSPLGTKHAIEVASKAQIPLFVGTTGLGPEFEPLLRELSKRVPVIKTANTSIGIAVMTALAVQASSMLDEKYDVEIVEIHHRAKKDAPSGTAISLGAAIANARGQSFEKVSELSRQGNQALRKDRAIGIQAVRGGDVTGEHTIYFIGDGERLELTHRVTNRRVFAQGALKGASWLVKKPPGLYQMADIFSR